MLKTLSSPLTFWAKFIFPMIWIAMFGQVTILMWTGIMQGKDGAPPDTVMKWIFPIAWIACAIFILWFNGGLKRVKIDTKNIYISNYFHEISLPLSKISRVTENRWINSRPVTIYFSSNTDFGERITFIPTIRLFGFWSSHPVVAELKQLAGIICPESSNPREATP